MDSQELLPPVALLDQYLFDGKIKNLDEFTQYQNSQPIEEMPDIKNVDLFTYQPSNNLISSEEYPGPYDFNVCIIPVATKQPWVYSNTLNKVFMDMSNPFPIDFKVRDFQTITENLWVRATPKYVQPQYLNDIVHRCHNHEHLDQAANPHERHHIIRCHNKNSTYCGDKSSNQRLSVVIPLDNPEPGSESVKVMYEFGCKNSCPTPGMNRRAIEVIFTLENAHNEILGRRVLNVRICSCPKRDKEKEEAEWNKAGGPAPPPGKKRKLNPKTDKRLMQSGDLSRDAKDMYSCNNIMGKEMAIKIHRYYAELLAAEAYRHVATGTDGPYKRQLQEVNQKLAKLEG